MLYETSYRYGTLEIDCAINHENQRYISFPTIEAILNYRANSTRKKLASKSFKAFLPEDYRLGKISCHSVNKNTQNSWIPIDAFYKLIYWEVKRGNDEAINLVVTGFITDFQSSFEAALGNQLDEEQRQYLRTLVDERLKGFKAWTDIIRERYVTFYGIKPEGWVYGKLVKKANLALFGVPDFGSDRTKNMTDDQQKTVKLFEEMLQRTAGKYPSMEPEAVLDKVIDMF